MERKPKRRPGQLSRSQGQRLMEPIVKAEESCWCEGVYSLTCGPLPYLTPAINVHAIFILLNFYFILKKRALNSRLYFQKQWLHYYREQASSQVRHQICSICSPHRERFRVKFLIIQQRYWKSHGDFVSPKWCETTGDW